MSHAAVRRITFRSSDAARLLGMAFLFMFVWRFFWLVHAALFVMLLAVLIAIVLHEPARLLSRWIPFRAAILLVLAVFLAMLAGVLVALIPQLVEQGTQLVAQLPDGVNSVAEWIRARTGRPPSPELAGSIRRQMGEFMTRFLPLAFNAVTTLVGGFAVIVLATFLAAQPAAYRDALLVLVPPHARPRWRRLLDEAGNGLRRWTIGKVCTMAAVGVATWLGLSLMGVPGALALGCLAAVLEFIPNFGPTLAAVPAVVAGFSVSPATAVYVAVFYFALQQVQNAVTVPLVERRAVNIPPAVLLVWQLMLAMGFGVLALFVATPLLSVIVTAVKILYVEPRDDVQRWDRREEETPASAADIAHPAAAADTAGDGDKTGED